MTTLPWLATAMNSARDPDVLRTIGLPGVALAVWMPEQPEGFQQWIDALPAGQLPCLRATLPARDARAAITTACDRARTPAGPHRDHLIDRAATLAGLASEIFASLLVELRLDVTGGQPCPKWHLDTVPARMLCTLRGPGTEFGPTLPDGTPAVIHRLPTSAAALFRGLLWPEREIPGIVHRSPPGASRRDAATARRRSRRRASLLTRLFSGVERGEARSLWPARRDGRKKFSLSPS